MRRVRHLLQICFLSTLGLIQFLALAVLIVDARAWIQGKRHRDDLDWQDILVRAPLMKKQEVPDEALVGVVHNIGYWMGSDGPMVNLNLYAVIVFMSKVPTQASRK